MRALVTGATGFIGQAVVKQLVEQGHVAKALVRPRRRNPPDPVAELRKHGAEIVDGNLFDRPVLEEALRDTDIVYHLAWQWHRPDVPGAPDPGSAEDQWRANVDGTHALILACKQAHVRRFIFTSTIAIYPPRLQAGIQEDGPTLTPETLRGRPTEDYVAPKLAVEEMIRHLLPEPDYVIFRPSMVYSAAAQWAVGVIRGMLFGPPRMMVQPVNWIHVDDLARAMLLAANTPSVANMTFNLAGNETVRSDQFREAIQHITDRLRQGLAGAGNLPPFEQLVPKYDTTRARQRLGFEPRIRLIDGLQQMIAPLLPLILANSDRQWQTRFS